MIRKLASIRMKVQTINLMKRLERMEGMETLSMMNDKGGLCDLIEESFQSRDNQYDFEYEMNKMALIIREGSNDD